MKFIYDTGLRRTVFQNVRLWGSWDTAGRHSTDWSCQLMREASGPDGSIVFEAEVSLAASEVGKEFHWRVVLDGPLGLDRQGIVTEQHGLGHDALHRTFKFAGDPRVEQRYYLTHVRRLGACPVRQTGNAELGLRFAVWAPNAEAVDVVFGHPSCGYIADDGAGIDESKPVLALQKGDDGVWSAGPEAHPELAHFVDFIGAPYMYRVRKEGGRVAYRSDLYSRAQVGGGAVNPGGAAYQGDPRELDGVVSCSLVVDTERVATAASTSSAEVRSVSEDEFWRDEFNHAVPPQSD